MNDPTLMPLPTGPVFAGIDWASVDHAVCVVDATGRAGGRPTGPGRSRPDPPGRAHWRTLVGPVIVWDGDRRTPGLHRTTAARACWRSLPG